MEKKKIGFWLPYREEMRSVSYTRPGMLLEPVRRDFLRHLQKHPKAELVEFADVRLASLRKDGAWLGEENLSALDGFVWLGEIGRDWKREYNLEVLKAIERGCPLMNCTFGYQAAMDKLHTSSILASHGVPVPDFIALTRENAEAAVQEAQGWGSVLLKPRLGSYGIGIIKLDNPADLVDFADYAPAQVHFVERFVPNDPASWIGINVIGGKHAYSYRKGPESFHGGWKVFDRTSTGGKMLLAKPTEKQLGIALQVAKLFKMDWVGVDIITDSAGNHYVIDVNAFPGLYPEMFMQAGVDGTQMMAEAVLARIGV